MSNATLSETTGDTVTSYNGYLGYGYNVVEKGYYNPKDITLSSPVLDMEKLASGKLIRRRQGTENRVFNITGKTASEYENDLLVQTGISGSGMFFKVPSTRLLRLTSML